MKRWKEGTKGRENDSGKKGGSERTGGRRRKLRAPPRCPHCAGRRCPQVGAAFRASCPAWVRGGGAAGCAEHEGEGDLGAGGQLHVPGDRGEHPGCGRGGRSRPQKGERRRSCALCRPAVSLLFARSSLSLGRFLPLGALKAGGGGLWERRP